MLFLVRCTERGKEPHAAKNKLRNDIADRLRAALPDVRLTFDVGRIYVEHARDIRDELARLHGVLSFSPCTTCDLDDLEAHVTAIAAPLLAPSRSFRVKVRRSGQHSFSSNAKAAELGAHLLALVPGAKVDLSSPEVEIAIEIRDRTCHVCTEVIAGLDAQLSATGAGAALEGGATLRGAAVEGAGPTASTSAGDEPRFLVDAMLGTLASRLRAFGYDTVWRRDTADSLLLREAHAEGRVVLTQDRELSEIGGASAFFVHGRTVDEQLDHVRARFGLTPAEARLFTRCSVCNALLVSIAKDAVRARVPPRAFDRYDAFWTCRPCDKIYWKGSHYDEMLTLLHAARARG